MLSFDLSNFELKAQAVGKAAKQVPFVTAFALTQAMMDAKAAEIGVMRSVFDRPTPFTLNALKVRPATKRNLTAELGFKEGFGSIPAWKFLGPQVRGGTRRHKRHEKLLIGAGLMLASEFAVPGKACPLDGFGNISGGYITRVLSALGAQSDRMQNTTRRPKRGNRTRNLDFFVLRGTKAPNGIYLREGRAAKPIILFVGSVSYARRFPYYEEAQKVVPVSFKRHMVSAWQRFVVDGVKRAA